LIRDLDTLVFDIADRKRVSDLEELYRRLAGPELFAPVIRSNVRLSSGVRLTIRNGEEVQLQLGVVGGYRVTPFYLHSDDTLLGRAFIGMDLPEVLTMIDRGQDLDGFAIYNRSASFVIVLRSEFPFVRECLGSSTWSLE
jgi:hypothetical protein